MIFLDPWFLLLIVAVPFWIVLRRRRSGRTAALFPAASEAGEAAATWRTRTAWIPAFLQGAGFLLFVAALARPVQLVAEIPIFTEGIDLALVVDCSSSMGEAVPDNGSAGGEEGGPTSIDVVRDAASRFVLSRRGDRVALVSYSRAPCMESPFTLDREAVAARLRALEAVPQGSDEDGTAIGAALAEAAGLFRDSRTEGREVLLLTDGLENRFSVEPMAAARLCAGLGVPVHTVALDLGTERLDTELHEKIARITGGRFFRVEETGGIEAAHAVLDRVVKSPAEKRSLPYYRDAFRICLVPGILLVAAAFCLQQTVFRRVP